MKKKLNKKPKIRLVTVDRLGDLISEIKAAVKPFGLYVYSAPCCDDSDMVGFLISDTKLTKKQIQEESDDFLGMGEE